MLDHRYRALQVWTSQTIKNPAAKLIPLTGDASFRRYFRVQMENHTLVAMDAPPDKENIQPFIAISQAFAQHGVHVPDILASNQEQGFALLTDFGDHLFLNLLNIDNVDNLYQKALNVLPRIQACQQQIPHWPLPQFDETHIRGELNLFNQWYLIKHLEKYL
jgi:hypothetical protein